MLKNVFLFFIFDNLLFRSTKARLGEETVEEEEKKEKAALRGKCMPRKKFSGSSKQPKK